MDDTTASHATSACQFIGGPGTVNVDPDLRWTPELGGWISTADPTAAPDLAGDPPVASRTIRYERHPGNRFELERP